MQLYCCLTNTDPIMDNQPTEPPMVEQPTEAPMDNHPTELPMDNQPTEPSLVEDATEPPVRVKLRKGQYIVTFDKRKAGSIDLNFHVDKCLKQNVFNALRKNAVHRPKKPRKLDTVANLTPEQLERKRASRREYYNNNKNRLNALFKEKYNNDPVYWEKKLTASLDRYHRLHANIPKKKPGRKPKVKDSTPSTTASDEEEKVTPISDQPKKKLGRPRKVNFGNGNCIENDVGN